MPTCAWRARTTGSTRRDFGDAPPASRCPSDPTFHVAWHASGAQGPNGRLRRTPSWSAGTSSRRRNRPHRSYSASAAGRFPREEPTGSGLPVLARRSPRASRRSPASAEAYSRGKRGRRREGSAAPSAPHLPGIRAAARTLPWGLPYPTPGAAARGAAEGSQCPPTTPTSPPLHTLTNGRPAASASPSRALPKGRGW